MRRVALRRYFSMGLALQFVGYAPSDIGLREARVKVLGIGPLHNFLERSPPIKLFFTDHLREPVLTANVREGFASVYAPQ